MVHKNKPPKSMIVNLHAGDVFHSSHWELTHTSKGQDPMKVVEKVTDRYIEKGYVDKEDRTAVIKKAKIYMDEFIKKHGKPPK